MKKCIRCNQEKELKSFCGKKNTFDRLNNVCKICINKRSKELRNLNKTPKIKLTKEEKRIIYSKKRHQRINSDPIFKLKSNTRSMIYNSFKRSLKGKFRKSIKTEILLGCSMDQFIEHLKNLFTDGMSLDNYGQWHIDHIKPLYYAENYDDICLLSHYTNLQPLWASDNRKKSFK